jgi:dihydrodipicolinate synthase/N-acetylneuraminate lyase
VAYTWDELKGVYAMMPAFETPDAGDIRTKNSIDVDNLHDAIDKVIKDGVQLIATMSGSGEGWNLLWPEFQTLVRETLDAVRGRAPIFFGCLSANPRETVEKIEFVREAGGQGILLGLPFYHQLTTQNVVAYYQTIGKMFPDLSFSIYHNPVEFKVHIPVPAYREIVKMPNFVCTKDSHRQPLEFQRMMEITHGKIAHFVNYPQLYPYYEMGASGCWAFDLFMGPWPILKAYQAAVDGDRETLISVIRELTGGRAGGGKREQAEGGSGRTPQELAGYIHRGPPRPPHFHAHVDDEGAAEKVAMWRKLCEKYRPEVEAWRRAHGEL